MNNNGVSRNKPYGLCFEIFDLQQIEYERTNFCTSEYING